MNGMTPWLYFMDGKAEAEASELTNVTLLENSTLVLFVFILDYPRSYKYLLRQSLKGQYYS
ncbi:hypothetical protein CUC15_13805 [Oceanobacillus zhaokaii]|uniref:Uncharacterized protein n=1 Tax=Oceanobacillus zhaokaii TaxID=2052660 RepID=A0A345PIV8_9BACI|nr:hypothetical protein CUC15_13805 [Oceanobacillus zhaokaii]